MHRPRKHIHAADPLHRVPPRQKDLQIPCKAGGLTGDIEQFVHAVGYDLDGCTS